MFVWNVITCQFLMFLFGAYLLLNKISILNYKRQLYILFLHIYTRFLTDIYYKCLNFPLAKIALKKFKNFQWFFDNGKNNLLIQSHLPSNGDYCIECSQYYNYFWLEKCDLSSFFQLYFLNLFDVNRYVQTVNVTWVA